MGRIEECGLAPEAFDAAYSLFVVEHVEEPIRFLRSVRRALKPGASFFFITPNLNHYFALLSRATDCLGMQEALLRLLRGRSGSDYHFRALYRLNSRRRILRVAAEAGFSDVEIRLTQSPENLLWYFPRGLRWAPATAERVIALLRWEALFMNIPCRMRKPHGE